MRNSSKQEYWVANISPRNVTLADLALNIKAFGIVNLLNKKHYNYTFEQLEKSRISGSIFKKSNMIKVRNSSPPIIEKKTISISKDATMPSRAKSIFQINEVEYDELKVAENKEMQKILDEEYAKETVELEETEIAPKKGKNV